MGTMAMYKRKIEKVLSQWKNKEGHKPLVIKGCRQCGKTSSVLDFAHRNYKYVVCMDFHEHKEYSILNITISNKP